VHAAVLRGNGRFAYVANALSNDVSVYGINATTGALTPVPGSPFAADFGSISVAFSPNGQFAYVANDFADNVSAFSINTTTGALTAVPGSPFAAGGSPTSVTTAAPEKSCEHHDEEERDERDDRDGRRHDDDYEQREDRGRDDYERHEGRRRDDDAHHRLDRKHGCHDFREKDFDEHDHDDAHER
jgi:hypothetical protein